MPTLYVENVPDELYNAIRSRAKKNRTSISAEVLVLLAENMPTQSELARRKTLLKHAVKLQRRQPVKAGHFPSSEELLREDRAR